MTPTKSPNAPRWQAMLGEHREVLLPPVAAPGEASDATQAFGGPRAATLDAVLRITSVSAEPEESPTPQDEAAEAVADLFAFAAVLGDEEAAQALEVHSVGRDGVYLLRAHASTGLDRVVAMQRPTGWIPVVLAAPDGSTPPRLEHRTDANACIEITKLDEGQWLAAFDLTTGQHASLTRDAAGKLHAYVGDAPAFALLEGDVWQTTQPSWLRSACEQARQVGGWLAAVDALGSRLRAGAQPKLRSLPEIIAYGDELHAWASERIPRVAVAALQSEALDAAAKLATRGRRLLPPKAALGAVDGHAELDAELWDGEHLSAEGELWLAELLIGRDRLESLRSVLALVDSDRPIHPALDDADIWLRRAAERGRRSPINGEAGARLAAVWVAEPNAWWSAR